MNNAEQNTITVPGIGVVIGTPSLGNQEITSTTVSSAIIRFDNVKHLLSSRPLRKPYRPAPIDENNK